jgi:cysteine-rich repeat protein
MFVNPTRKLFIIWLLGLLGWLCAEVLSAQPVQAGCGNGIVETGEDCDDGNLRDGDGCSKNCKSEQACYDSGNRFAFFTWGDSYPGGGEEGVWRILTDAVDSRKYPDRLLPRFWIGVGDMPFMTESYGLLDMLNDAISNSDAGKNYPFACRASNGKFPFFVAVGNHDVDVEPVVRPEEKYEYWSNLIGPRLPATLVGIQNFKWGPHAAHEFGTTYSFDYKNVHFVIVNQYHGDPSYPSDNPVGCIRDDLYEWVHQDLTRTDKSIRFVFGHEPAWPYCSYLADHGGEDCQQVDRQDPPYRSRPHSVTGDWGEAFGRHWGDCLEDQQCPEGSRDRFWRMLAKHRVVAHFVGHTHSYGSRLVTADGRRRNDVSIYAKAGDRFGNDEGVWEISHGFTLNSTGCAYVLTTIKDETVFFEAYDQRGPEQFKMIEAWSVKVQPATTLAEE